MLPYVLWDIDGEWKNLRCGGNFVEEDFAVPGLARTLELLPLFSIPTHLSF